MSLQIYNNWSEYESDHVAGVSLILSDNTVMYNGQNVSRKRPKVGDFYVKINGKKRFIDPYTATSELVNSIPVVGKVYRVRGKKFYFVGGVNNHSEQWSNVCDYQIIPDSSLFDDALHSLTVTLQNTAIVTPFEYTYRGEADPQAQLADFISKLNSWLADHAAKWEAYVDQSGRGILQMSTYDSYESTCSITSCTLTKLVGSELAAETVNDARNENGQDFNYYQVMCYDRALSYFATSGSTPTTAPTNIVANQAPVTRVFFEENVLGANLRTLFGTYENYIEKCQVHLEELNRGVMKFRTGKLMTEKLLQKTVSRRGDKECPYAAAVWAHRYGAMSGGNTIEGHGAGTWWSPSMYELGALMRGIKTDYSDPVSYGMNLVAGWSRISPASYHWSVCRYSGDHAWNYYSHGIVYSNGFYLSFRVLVVSESVKTK